MQQHGYTPSYAGMIKTICESIRRDPSPILELGSGPMSTPIIAGICHAFDVKFISIENDAWWHRRTSAMLKVNRLPAVCHQYVGDGTGNMMHFLQNSKHMTSGWGVVIVDCSPAAMRPEFIKAFLRNKNAETIIAHDTEQDHYHSYGWDDDFFESHKAEHYWGGGIRTSVFRKP